MTYRDLRKGVEGAIAAIQETPVRRYTQRFSPTQYEGVVTAFNRGAVTRLDSIADELNTLASLIILTDEKYRALHCEASKLLFGPQREEDFGASNVLSSGRLKR